MMQEILKYNYYKREIYRPLHAFHFLSLIIFHLAKKLVKETN
jgi:hypothetical protein